MTSSPSSSQSPSPSTSTSSSADGASGVSLVKRRMDDVPAEPVAMDGVSGVRMRLLVGRRDGAPTFSMRQFTVEPGGHTPDHEHNYEHEVVVLRGGGEVMYDGVWHAMEAGEVMLIEPNVRHQFRNTGAEPLEFLCLVPVTHDCGKPTPGS